MDGWAWWIEPRAPGEEKRASRGERSKRIQATSHSIVSPMRPGDGGERGGRQGREEEEEERRRRERDGAPGPSTAICHQGESGHPVSGPEVYLEPRSSGEIPGQAQSVQPVVSRWLLCFFVVSFCVVSSSFFRGCRALLACRMLCKCRSSTHRRSVDA